MIRYFSLALITLLLLTACDKGKDNEERADVGYSDGYAVGYNTECKIRVTFIEGDWENKAYKEAYHRGEYDGKTACIEYKKNQSESD